MVTDPFLVGVFFGFVPAMGLLYILLHEYHALFQEKRMFRTFLFGMIAGVLVTVLEQGISPAVTQLVGLRVAGAAAALTVLAVALLVGLLEALAFTAILNWRTFRAKRDTPFYGVAFGIGFGGTQVLVLMSLVLRTAEALAPSGGFTWVDAVLVTMLGLFFIGGILVHGAVGAWIGHGTGMGPLAPMVLRSMVAIGAYIAGFYAILLGPAPWISHTIAIAGLAFGLVLVSRVIVRRLDGLVPIEILREIGIHNRRLARRVVREGPPGDPPGPT